MSRVVADDLSLTKQHKINQPGSDDVGVPRQTGHGPGRGACDSGVPNVVVMGPDPADDAGGKPSRVDWIAGQENLPRLGSEEVP